MCAGDYPSFLKKEQQKTTLRQVELHQWPTGSKHINVGRTDASTKYPDIVTVKNAFETAHDTHLLVLGIDTGATFLMPVSGAELIYQRQGHARPELF